MGLKPKLAHMAAIAAPHASAVKALGDREVETRQAERIVSLKTTDSCEKGPGMTAKTEE